MNDVFMCWCLRRQGRARTVFICSHGAKAAEGLMEKEINILIIKFRCKITVSCMMILSIHTTRRLLINEAGHSGLTVCSVSHRCQRKMAASSLKQVDLSYHRGNLRQRRIIMSWSLINVGTSPHNTSDGLIKLNEREAKIRFILFFTNWLILN